MLYCYIPVCASVSTELIFVDTLVCTLTHTISPDLCKIPGKQFYQIQCSQENVPLLQETNILDGFAGKQEGGGRENCLKT